MAKGGRPTASLAKICTSPPPLSVWMSPDSRHWEHPLADPCLKFSCLWEECVSPPTSSSLLSFPAQKHLPQEHTGTVTRQSRRLHLQSLSDLASAIKADYFVLCWFPSSPLLQYTLKRLAVKASDWDTFLFPMNFGPPLGCIFSFLCHHLGSCSGKHTQPTAPHKCEQWRGWHPSPGAISLGQPPLAISCLQTWI